MLEELKTPNPFPSWEPSEPKPLQDGFEYKLTRTNSDSVLRRAQIRLHIIQKADGGTVGFITDISNFGRPLARGDFGTIFEFMISTLKKHNASALYAYAVNDNLFGALSRYGVDSINGDAPELSFLGDDIPSQAPYVRLSLPKLEELKGLLS